MRRRRFRTWAKLAGTVLCVVTAAAFIVSTRWVAGIEYRHGSGRSQSWRSIGIKFGMLGYAYDQTDDWNAPETRFHCILWSSVDYSPRSGATFYWPPYAHFATRTDHVEVPLWILFLSFAIPTVLCWRSDRIATKLAHTGTCSRCGYDRRGLAGDARCPECGTAPK